MNFVDDIEFARSIDKASSVNLREQFIIPTHHGKDAIYFLGNSLGLQPKATSGHIKKVLDTWSAVGVEGFFKGDNPWLNYHDALAEPLAKIVGALPHEVIIMNSLTVNLHLMMVSFYQPVGKRNKIICEAKAFPSDQYMLETHIKQRGLDPAEVLIEVTPRNGSFTITEEDIFSAIEDHKDTVALVFWGGVNYYTGQVFDMLAITEKAHEAGALAGFDLAHAAGNIALNLHQWDVDFACWCNYKYLNSGPGAVGAAYVHEKHHGDKTLQRYAGWWGYQKETRFKMEQGFVPISSAEGWGLSTPSPILFASLKASLEIFSDAGMQTLQEKARLLSSYMYFLLSGINEKLSRPLIQIITPDKESQRGCQISILMLAHGRAVFEYLTEQGIFADWREPDVIRVAPAPLYNTFEEVWQFAKHLERACKMKDYDA